MKNKIYKLSFLGLSTAIAATASYALISPENSSSEYNSAILSLPAIYSEPASLSINNPIISTSSTLVDSEFRTIIYEIKKGDNLSKIFAKLELDSSDLNSIINTSILGKQFATISTGKKLIVNLDFDGKLQQLLYKKDLIDTLKATRTEDNTFDIETISKPIERRIASIQTTINSSFYLDGKKAGFSDNLIIQLAEIFAWDIDFALNLRKNDKVTIVYEKLFVDGKEFGTGNIISAEFVNQGHSYTAVMYKDKNNNVNYYTPKGKSLRKAFLRTPVDFTRISSHFNLKRKHPVLNKLRAHKGVDYAAKTGTPIKTTGNGKIVFRGRKGGYGRVLVVQHGRKYSTLYAHLSSFKKGQKVGNRIKQGDVIGYVGQSGLASGPHLHYEFRVNGVHRNPLTVKLPLARPIKRSLFVEFKEKTQPFLALLDKAKANNLLAQNQL